MTKLSNAAKSAGFEVRRVQVSVKNARNGNMHNPTPVYRYQVWRAGVMVDHAARYGDAVESANEVARALASVL